MPLLWLSMLSTALLAAISWNDERLQHNLEAPLLSLCVCALSQGEITYAPPLPYMREIGTMWQIGVLTGKPRTFLVQNGSFSAFWHYENKERLSGGLDVKWHILLLVLMRPESGFLLEFTA